MRPTSPFAVIVLAVIACGSSIAHGQQPQTVWQGGVSESNSVPPGTVYQGSASENNYSPLDPRNFPQEDPRQVQPEQMPAALQGNQRRCIPPDRTWTLLVEYQNQCLYAAPLSDVKKWLYGNNVVIPVSQMLQLGAQAGRCGPDPWDPNKAVCSGGSTPPAANAGATGYRYGPYTYAVAPSILPAQVRQCLSDGTCAPDDPNAPYPHIQATLKGRMAQQGPQAASAGHPVGSTWACRACDGDGQVCYRPSAEFTECADPTVVKPPAYALPLPPNVRSTLLNAAAQMDTMAAGAQGYSLAATNHFFDCLREAVDGDLRFLAQPAYVPAAQLAKSLHEGVWTYLTSNPYKNNLGAYDGAVAAMKRAMRDPACSFAQTTNAVAIAAATGGPKTAMAEASEGLSAAQAALNAAKAAEAIEQESPWLARAPWYVPGLRCPGCLVYGTVEGGYADFANSVGGRTINSLPKPVNLNWEQFSQQVLDGAAADGTPVLFSLVKMEDIPGLLAGTGEWAGKVTSFELRHIRQNWGKFQNIVRFYKEGRQVDPPWMN